MEDFSTKISKPKTAVQNDIEQSIVRLVIGISILVYTLWPIITTGSRDSTTSVGIATTFLIYAALLTCAALFLPFAVDRKVMRYAGITGDAVFLTIAQILVPVVAAPLIGVYLWVIIGNGFRYGLKYMNVGMVACGIGFLVSLYGSSFWKDNISLGVGVFLTFLLLSVYSYLLMHRVEVARELSEKARKAAQEANQAKGTFLANMSHELRNPLNVVIGMTDLLTATDLDKEQKEMVMTVSKSGNMLLSVINDILDLSKIESDYMRLDNSQFSLSEVIDEIKFMIEASASRKHITFLMRAEKDLPAAVHGDALRLRQVLLNLLSNSVKFTEVGRVELEITHLETTRGVATYQFSILDTGIGMSAQEVREIVKPFTQAKASIGQKHGGTGLGTTIASRLINMMGGELKIESTPGIGSRFIFSLPFTLGEETYAENSKRSSPASNIQQLAGKTVLVADDNETNRLVAQKMLEKSGYRVELACDGDEALDALIRGKIDVAVLDMYMPRQNGATVTKLYHYSCPEKVVPIIILTADTCDAAKDECEGAGVSRFLTKPVKRDILSQCVESVLADAPQYASPDEQVQDTNDISIFKKSFMDELFGKDDFSKMDTLVSQFRRNVRVSLNDIDYYVSRSDLANLVDELYNLKGSALSIGAMRLAFYCDKLLTAASTDDVINIYAGIEKLRECFAQTDDSINDYLSNRRREFHSQLN